MQGRSPAGGVQAGRTAGAPPTDWGPPDSASSCGKSSSRFAIPALALAPAPALALVLVLVLAPGSSKTKTQIRGAVQCDTQNS